MGKLAERSLRKRIKELEKENSQLQNLIPNWEFDKDKYHLWLKFPKNIYEKIMEWIRARQKEGNIQFHITTYNDKTNEIEIIAYYDFQLLNNKTIQIKSTFRENLIYQKKPQET